MRFYDHQLVVDVILGCIGGLEPLPALSSPDAILIGCRIPSQDDMERFSRRQLPRNIRGDRDLAIRSNRAFELDCLHARMPRFIIALQKRSGHGYILFLLKQSVQTPGTCAGAGEVNKNERVG